MNVETLVETDLAIVLPGFFAPLLATDDKMEQDFPRLRPALTVWLEFSLVLWIACLSVIGQSEKALLRSNEKSSNFHFFLVYIMCNFLYCFHSHISTWNPVPLQSYSTTFQSVTGPGTSGTRVLKNCSSLFEPCVVWHAKVHSLHIHKVNCQQRPFFYPASAYSFILVSATASRLRPSCQENISKKGILKRQMYKLPHFILCASELSPRFFHHFYSKYLVAVLLI